MLSLNQTFEDTRAIKVLVIPVGNNSLFDAHFQVVSRLREIPFFELNRPQILPSNGGTSKILTSSLKHINWSQGNLRFEYLRYDRVLLGPGDLDNFQSSKRVLMIMGIINYAEIAETAQKVEEELDYYSRRHPNIILRRIFVFNYFVDVPNRLTTPLPPKSFSKDPSSVVVFPPEGVCGEGEVTMVDVHLKEVMCHAAVKLIESLEKQINHCEEARIANNLPVCAPLTTSHDDMEDADGNPSNASSGSVVSSSFGATAAKLHKRLYNKGFAGRIHKWMGDLCMQVCSPLDSWEYYNLAISECRLMGDSLWLAGALDGYASAVLLLMSMQIFDLEDLLGKELKHLTPISEEMSGAVDGSEQTVEARSLRLAEEKGCEALAIYGRSAVFCVLEVECSLRMAKMHETSPWSCDREQKVLEYVLKATSVQGLSSQQQLECMLEGGLIFHRLGLQRKFGFFLYAATLLCIESENFSFAHSLICCACEHFGIQAECRQSLKLLGVVPAAITREDSDLVGDVVVVNPERSWPVMRAALFTNGSLIASSNGDLEASSRFLSALLREMGEVEQRHIRTRRDWLFLQQLLTRKPDPSQQNSKLSGLANFTSPTSANQRQIPLAVPVHATTVASYSNAHILDERAASPPPVKALKIHSNPPLHNAQNSKDTESLSFTVAESATAGHHRLQSMDSFKSFSSSNNRVSGRFDSVVNNTMDNAFSSSDASARLNRKAATASSTLSNVGIITSSSAKEPHNVQRMHPLQQSTFSRDSSSSLTALDQSQPTAVTVSAADRPSSRKHTSDLVNLAGNRMSFSLVHHKDSLETEEFSNTTSTTSTSTVSRNNAVEIGRTGKGRSYHLRFAQVPRKLVSLVEELNTFAVPVGTADGSFMVEDEWWMCRFQQRWGLSETMVAVLDSTSSTASASPSSSAFLQYISLLLSEQLVPISQQQEVWGLFLRLSSRISPHSRLRLPVTVVSVRPRRVDGPHGSPAILSDVAAVKTASKALAKLVAASGDPQQLEPQQDELSAGPEPVSSALYFDPFAAKRARLHLANTAQSVEVLWPVGGDYSLSVQLSNPFASNMSLSSISPVLDSSLCDHCCSLTIYPVQVTVPARAEAFEVLLRISLHPLAGQESSPAVGTLKVLGLLVRVNNAEFNIPLDSTGLPSTSAARSRLAVGNSSSGGGGLSGIPTNDITIVPPLPALSVEASWHSLHRPFLPCSTFSSADVVNLSLDLMQGETRTESLSIRQLVLEAVDASGRSVRLDGRNSCSDLKVVLEEMEESSDGTAAVVFKAAAAKNVLLDFSGPLFLPADSCNNQNKSATNNNSKGRPSSSHCELAAHRTSTSSSSSSSSSAASSFFHCDELTLQFRCPAKPLVVVLQVELVCGFEGANLVAIQRLNSGQAVQELCLHPVLARRLTVKVQLIPQPGLQLGRVQLQDRARPWHGAEPAVLAGQLRQRLAAGQARVRVKEVADEQLLAIELTNVASEPMAVGSNAADLVPLLQGDPIPTPGHSSASFLECLAPLSSRRILLPLSSSPVDLQVFWAVRDPLRHLAHAAVRLRSGSLSCYPPESMLKRQPSFRTNCRVVTSAGTMDGQTALLVQTLQTIDIEVYLQPLCVPCDISGSTIELHLLILNRETSIPASTASRSCPDFVVSGQLHRRVTLEENQQSLHRLRVSFLRQGRYSLHPLFRLLQHQNCRTESDVMTEGDEVWWSSPATGLIVRIDSPEDRRAS